MYTQQQYNNELFHHGVKGMKWGVRQYQNPDGTYTEAGRLHYGFGDRRRNGNMPYEEKVKMARNSGAFKSFLEKRKRAKAQKIVNKLDSFSKTRKKFLTSNQKRSVEEAKAYWSAVANGKSPSKNRNIIKRYFDQRRADSAPVRVAKDVGESVLRNTAIEVGKHYIVKKTQTGYYPVNIRRIALKSTTGLGKQFVLEEMLTKILGHY